MWMVPPGNQQSDGHNHILFSSVKKNDGTEYYSTYLSSYAKEHSILKDKYLLTTQLLMIKLHTLKKLGVLLV